MTHILKNIKFYSIVLLIILLSFYSFIIYNDYLSKELTVNKLLINGISILGVYFTILGIGYTFKQIVLVKDEVDKALKDVSEFLVYSDISTKIKQIEEIQSFILNNKPELAKLRMADLRALILEIKHNNKLKNYYEKELISLILTNLSIDMRNINDTIYPIRK